MTTEPIAGAGHTAPDLLIVDDSAIMRTMIRRVASIAGSRRLDLEAANGHEALAVLSGTPSSSSSPTSPCRS